MKRSLAVVVIVAAVLAGTAEAGSPALPFESDADRAPRGRIDESVLERLGQLGVAPAKVCSDGVFVRRVYLDVTGTLPTADEARRFLRDNDPD